MVFYSRTLHDLLLRGEAFRRSSSINHATGGGKAQPYSAKILTPRGWQNMGALTRGMKVVTPSGTLATIKNNFPQGWKTVYSIHTVDGRRTECCGEHLWKVWSLGEGWHLRTTNELIRNEDVYSLPLPGDLSGWSIQPTCSPKAFTKLLKNGWVSTGGDAKIAKKLCQLVRSKGFESSFNLHSVTCRQAKKIAIAAIKRVGVKEVQCLATDSPEGLYVTDDYIVTHNTFNVAVPPQYS